MKEQASAGVPGAAGWGRSAIINLSMPPPPLHPFELEASRRRSEEGTLSADNTNYDSIGFPDYQRVTTTFPGEQPGTTTYGGSSCRNRLGNRLRHWRSGAPGLLHRPGFRMHQRPQLRLRFDQPGD